MSWKDFLRGDGYWMMAKDWIDVQRQGKLEAMSRVFWPCSPWEQVFTI